jgi:hypothetical protein
MLAEGRTALRGASCRNISRNGSRNAVQAEHPGEGPETHFQAFPEKRLQNAEKAGVSRPFLSGRYWVRTSDPQLVELWVYFGLWSLVERFLRGERSSPTCSPTVMLSRAAA